MLLVGRVSVVCESALFSRENDVLGISKAQNFPASQGRRLKAGAAEAPRGRRGRELLIFPPAHRFVIDLGRQTPCLGPWPRLENGP